MAPDSDTVNVILVHGAWADGSSWSRVIVPLQERGLKVVAAPLPLTSLSDDVSTLERVIERTDGPLVLVAHAYAGAVISSCRSERVKALVFVAALAPDEGETVADVFYRKPPDAQAPHLAPDAHGFIWMPPEAFASAFAPDASADVISVLAAIQRPIALACIQEPLKAPAWRWTPSWFLIAERDHMINVETQRLTAKRMGAKIRSHAVDHAPLLTAPELVSSIISEAVEASTADNRLRCE